MSTTNNSAKVSTGKPKVEGAVHRAALSSTLVLPSDATTALANDFAPLGYISEDGVSETTNKSSSDIKAWGGDVVDVVQTETGKTWKLKLIESMNVDVLKTVFGDDNVSETSGKISISENCADLDFAAWVIETIMKGGRAQRIVIPMGKIISIAEIVYKDNEAIGYEVEIKAVPDASGNYDYKYIAAPST